VDEAVKNARQKELMKLQAAVSRKKNRALIKTEQTVLVDGPSKESPLVLVGRLPGQAPDVDGHVWLTETDETVRAGQFRRVRITKATAHDLVGEVVA
jgi:ribosomal protein S12 methylthiotransferase